jgi:2-dehydro-3-deoxygalactonokinase
MAQGFIALDWGTTSFRAYRANGAGRIADEITSPSGILAVENGRFAATLETLIGQWDRSLPVLAAGMITSRQGWHECPYVSCPAGAPDLARALTRITTPEGRTIHFVTGLHATSAAMPHDVMRGEETQVFGSLDSGADVFVTPGTHSKWIRVADGHITGFSTYMTGEVFAALRNHTILGRLMTGTDHNDSAFRRGLDAALADPTGFLHRIFAARSLALFGDLASDHIASYLSGLVIGSELAHALPGAGRHHLILASEEIGQRYLVALRHAGLSAATGDPRAIVRGLAAIARAGGIIP